jgi:hypothetical protein
MSVGTPYTIRPDPTQNAIRVLDTREGQDVGGG